MTSIIGFRGSTSTNNVSYIAFQVLDVKTAQVIAEESALNPEVQSIEVGIACGIAKTVSHCPERGKIYMEGMCCKSRFMIYILNLDLRGRCSRGDWM